MQFPKPDPQLRQTKLGRPCKYGIDDVARVGLLHERTGNGSLLISRELKMPRSVVNKLLSEWHKMKTGDEPARHKGPDKPLLKDLAILELQHFDRFVKDCLKKYPNTSESDIIVNWLCQDEYDNIPYHQMERLKSWARVFPKEGTALLQWAKVLKGIARRYARALEREYGES